MKNIERIMLTFLLLFPLVEMLGQSNGMLVTTTVEQPKGKGDFRVFGRVADGRYQERDC